MRALFALRIEGATLAPFQGDATVMGATQVVGVEVHRIQHVQRQGIALPGQPLEQEPPKAVELLQVGIHKGDDLHR